MYGLFNYERGACMREIVPIEEIQQRIFIIRGHRVMIDADIAVLYGVTTKRLNEQVKRNLKRFPSDFMFQLNEKEFENLRSHFATSSWGGRRYLPYVFTEHGAIMLANVLDSTGAVQAGIQVVRAFVKLRELLSTNKELAIKFDEEIHLIFKAIRQMMAPPEEKKMKIGFKREK
jgi:hypothetical protein